MHFLEKPIFEQLVDYFENPRTSERTYVPEAWMPREHAGTVIGSLSSDAWRIVGVMRDFDHDCQEILSSSDVTDAKREQTLAFQKVMNTILDAMLEVQITHDLLAAGVKEEQALFFCVREGGDVLYCVCKSISAMMGIGLEDLFGAAAVAVSRGRRRTQEV